MGHPSAGRYGEWRAKTAGARLLSSPLRPQVRGVLFEQEVGVHEYRKHLIIVVIVLIVLFVAGYFGRGRMGR
jgi:hypothetical protein